MTKIHPLVRDLYKRLMFVGRDYPLGPSYVREKVKEEFRKNAHLVDTEDVIRAVHAGRWWEKELIGVIKLKKYRTLRKIYNDGRGIDADRDSDYNAISARAKDASNMQ